jgi:hypothetical protein
MPDKISCAELMRRFSDPNLSAEEIEQYFKEVPNKAQPFSPRFEINENRVDLSGLSDAEEGVFFDVIVGILNRMHMRLRQRAYEERMRHGWRGLRFLAEGGLMVRISSEKQ